MTGNEEDTTAAAQAPAGWYPDPWFPGQQRFWDGRDWTAHSFPEHPGTAPTRLQAPTTPLPPPTTGVPGGGPPPPDWWAPPSAAPEPAPFPTYEAPQEPQRSWWPPRGRTLVALLILAAFMVGIVGGIILPNRTNTPSAIPSILLPTTLPSPTAPAPSPSPADPSASALTSLVLRQQDVTSTELVGTIAGGSEVTGGATLDLCNGTFASEALRTARLQVAGVDGNTGAEVLSTEAVLYATPAGATQALAELKAVAAACPNTPVVSPVGEPTITTHFNATPDGSWPQVAGVTRESFDFVVTDAGGQAQHITTAYLVRGRALLGVYFAQPDGPQDPVVDQTTLPGIVNVFAGRMAALPASAING